MFGIWKDAVLLPMVDIAPAGQESRPLPILNHLSQATVYGLATLFLVLSCLSFLSYFWVNKRIQNYKAQQLREFHSKYRNKRNYTYKEAGLYLPPLKKAFWSIPFIFGIVFAFVAITFFSGKSVPFDVVWLQNGLVEMVKKLVD